MRGQDEDHLLAWVARTADPASRGLLGDDAAFLHLSGDVALTVDTQIEGVHFLAGLDPALLARRLLAVNLSDLAACGAQPSHALLALAAPPEFDRRRFFRALLLACRRYGVRLAGGDLARSRQPTAVLTLLGRRPPGGRFVPRGAARPGDVLWLGGTVGESAAGFHVAVAGARLIAGRVTLPRALRAPRLASAARRALRRHLQPEPQLELGAWLGRRRRAAAIDLSDGLARDLHRLCRASGVGAEVEAERLPMPRGLWTLAAALGRDALALALGGGEDYVLLFALPYGEDPPGRFRCSAIGRVTERRRVVLHHGGRRRPLPALGWDHLSA